MDGFQWPNLQQDEDPPDDAPSGVVRESSLRLECAEEAGKRDRQEKIKEPVDGCDQ